MRASHTAALLTALAVAACASPRKPDLAMPAAFEAPASAQAAVDLDRWWLAFDDPQLTGLIEQALVRNTDVRTAVARLNEVRAQRLGVLLGFLPKGDLSGSTRRTETEQLSGTQFEFPGFVTRGSSESESVNFNVSWEIDLFGRTLAARRSANAEVAAQRFALEGSRAAIAAQVADSYFQARGLAIQLADAQETARIQRSLLDLATRRGRLGLAPTSESDRIAGDLAQAEAQAAGLEAELQAQRRAILILAGRLAEPTTAVDAPPQVGAAPAVPVTLPSQLLARRPDIREAEARVRSAAGRQDVAERAFFPTLTLTPGVGWSRTSQPGFENESWNWSIGGTIAQPILSIPNKLAELKAENARTEQAVIAYERAVQTAFGEAEGALVRLDADRRRVALLADGEARAGRAFRAARLGYERGLTDLNTLLSAEQAWRATRTQLTAAQVQSLRRTVQAYRALGGGWAATPASRQASTQVQAG
ncbi:efflux transporter outer membrane subunit [Phenylobacterium sp.]|jgi:multidrug efflux system outer membrane protein|uniref:efflux transporter outer membrane subunit n=1 Tax=Phenylobacterium sp. TaxID=1871053 RepID=UPI003784D9A0